MGANPPASSLFFVPTHTRGFATSTVVFKGIQKAWTPHFIALIALRLAHHFNSFSLPQCIPPFCILCFPYRGKDSAMQECSRHILAVLTTNESLGYTPEIQLSDGFLYSAAGLTHNERFSKHYFACRSPGIGKPVGD